MKRGEKAAAAATSTAGAVSATAGSTATNAAAVVASQVAPALPTLAEATVAASHAAPTLVPVIAKAAVGIGLVAAVLTPTSDSAMHQAVENMVSGSAGFVVSEPLGEPFSQETSATAAATGEQLLETLSPSSAVVIPIATNKDLSGSSAAEMSTGDAVKSVPGVGGAITVSELQLSPTGRGQYGIEGMLVFSTANGARDANLKDASRVRIAPEEGADGRQRLDAVLVAEFSDGAEAEVRLVGFARDMDASTQISGLYRSITPGIDLAQQGSFVGVIEFGDASTQGVFNLTLSP
jgi:hypothetical protein